MLLTSGLARAATVVEVVPLTDQMVIVRVLDGAVRHSANGQPFGDESVVTSPLNIIQATNPASYQISSTNDAFYIPAQAPVQVGRKTKGTDFAWLNPPNNWALEHWLYLKLHTSVCSSVRLCHHSFPHIYASLNFQQRHCVDNNSNKWFN